MSVEKPKSRDRSPNVLSIDDALIRDLIKKRGILKGRLTKFANYVQSLEPIKNNLTSQVPFDLKLRIKGATGLFTEFNDIQTKIEETVSDIDLSDQLDQRESFENIYYTTLAQAESMLSPGGVTDCSSVSSSGLKSVKLPTIVMPTFDGSCEHWLQFRDTFLSLVHNSNEISSIQKFHYLKSALKGQAALVIDSIEFSSENYSVAWGLLLNRYNNSRLLVHNHVKALFTINPLHKESPSLIRTLIDTILKNLRALKILGEPTDSWDTLVNYIIVSKLDKNTEREWETYKCSLFLNDDNTNNRSIRVDDLLKFLKCRADMLEAVQLSRNTHHNNIPVEGKKSHTNLRSQFTSHCNVSSSTRNSKSFDRSSRNKACLKCNANHPIYSCQKFIDSDLNSKYQLIREHKLCQNCLRPGHTLENCRFGPCRKCNQKHNSLLHNDTTDSSLTLHSIETTEGPNECAQTPSAALLPPAAAGTSHPIQVNKAHMQTRSLTSINKQVILLSTAIVEVLGVNGVYHKARALLDSGSQRCFITKSFCKLINATTIQSINEIRGIGNSVMQCSQVCNVEIKSCVDNAFKTQINCFVLPHITSSIPTVCQLSAEIYIPDNIQLADPKFYNSHTIDILIGADRFWDLLGEGKIRLPCGPYLLNTKLGWIISGPFYNNNLNKSKPIQCNFSCYDSLDSQLKLFWELENLPKLYNKWSKEEFECEEHFLHNTHRMCDGRFKVRIPLKLSPNLLGDSYVQAERRLFALEKRFQRSSEHKSLYVEFMREYEQLKHMTRVTSFKTPHYFLPHHGVYREHSTTTKLRVVFDASAVTSSGKSLNDLQLIGPALQGDLISILLRFRQHQYVVCADVEKMFRNCLVDEDQRELQMILWREEPTQPIGIYKLNTVTYGTASAPFLSVRCLKQLGIESSDPDVQRVIKEDFYVDDLLTGHDNKNKLLELCAKTKHALQLGCFPLRKWIYNFECDNNSIFSEQCKPLSFNDNYCTKTLGLIWNNVRDTFNFKTQIECYNNKITKRSILSNISQIFDPLGLLSPSIIIVKVLLQQLWLLKIGWDDEVPASVSRSWNQFVISLRALDSLSIPRHAIDTCATSDCIELHIFSDASQTAYGACVYIRTVASNKSCTVRLLFSKARVAPIKPITVPRLELCGALIAAELYEKVRNSLHIQFSRVLFWTDSTIVVGWLRMAPYKLKTFVQNRVVKIHELTEGLPWYHVSGKDNPADLASRGVDLEELSACSAWWEGPSFLRDPEFLTKNLSVETLHTDEGLPEIKSSVGSLVTNISLDVVKFFPFKRFSQYNRMRCSVAYMLRFIFNIRNKLNRRVGPLTVEELDQSQNVLIRWCQKESFPTDYELICSNKLVKCKNGLQKLNLFADDNKIIRVGGRLGNSDDFPYNKKHPILISCSHYFAQLLFRYEHLQQLHAASQALLFHIRETWWPLGGRNLVRRVIHACVTCTRIRGKTLTPMMGNLPKERITPSHPFNRCGVDYCGPVLILNRKGRGSKTVKAYICLFICFVSRAVHLELVGDLSTESYLLALKRFISRRGKPIEIYSDNGRNFVGLMNDFAKFLRTCSSEILEFATNQQIKFKFIPPYSPHFGGLWEAGVKSVKYHLRRVVGNAHLTFEEFITVLTQIEAVLNSRPLCPLSPDPRDLSPLTPAHFLVGRPLTAPACDDLTTTPVHRLQRYQRLEQIRQHFWSRWAKEYISELQVRSKWTENKDQLKKNSLVVIKDDNLPPLKWHIGRVVRTIPGRDGVSRVADIQTSSGVVRRAYVKICPLIQDA